MHELMKLLHPLQVHIDILNTYVLSTNHHKKMKAFKLMLTTFNLKQIYANI